MNDVDLSALKVLELSVAQWQRYKEIRIKSLISDPEAFGGDLEQIINQNQAYWEEKFINLIPVVAQLNDEDIAMMTVENLAGDFGTTCWIGGCWVKPEFRGKGVMRSMFHFVDQNASLKNWQVQGLGVWVDNFNAIAAYQAVGFVSKGDPKPSSSKPGMFYQRMIRKSINYSQ